MDINKLSDLNEEEYRQKLGFIPSLKDESQNLKFFSEEEKSVVKDSIDWRSKEHNVLTPVKDQKQCGSCWAFSAIETLESREALNGKPLSILSPQLLVDCDSNDNGCGGGLMQNAYEYLKLNGKCAELESV